MGGSFGGDTIVTDIAGPAAINSMFGWVLSSSVKARVVHRVTTTTLAPQESDAADADLLDSSQSNVSLTLGIEMFLAIEIAHNPDNDENDTEFLYLP